MKMNHILLCVQICSFFPLINATENFEQPFIFNPFTQEILNCGDSPDAILNGPIGAACPPGDKGEKKFNRKNSMEGKALFYKATFTNKEVPCKDIYKKVKCEKKIEMAVAFLHGKMANVVFEFGFEVYADVAIVPITFRTNVYEYFGPVQEALSIWDDLASFIRRPESPYYSPSGILSYEDLRFSWLPKMKTGYDVSLWSPINAEYTMYRNYVHQLDIKCQDHNIGKKFYKRKFDTFDGFYSVDNQKTVFGLVKLPDLPKKSDCSSTSQCVKKYDLLPPYNFQIYSSLPVSCSNLTTVPFWYEVNEELLKNVEKFLIAMSQVTERKLTIVPGSYGVISFPKINDQSESMRMYLNLKYKKIPIPKIIFKIVRYQSYNCDPEDELCWFSVVIVIHNQPKIRNKDRLCAQDLCEQWGWDIIQYTRPDKMRVKSNHIYCCNLDEDMKKKLRFDLGKEYNGDLNLKYFPYYDGENGKTEDTIDRNKYANKKKEFVDQLRNLL